MYDEFSKSFDNMSFFPNELSRYRSRKDVRLLTKLNMAHTIDGIPLIAANLDYLGVEAVARVMAEFKCFTALHKYHTETDIVRLANTDKIAPYLIFTFGIDNASKLKLDSLSQKLNFNQMNFCFDVANGYMESFVKFIKRFKDKYPDSWVLAGNIVGGEDVLQKYDCVDCVKIGIGSGSVCATSSVTGIKIPQYAAVKAAVNTISCSGNKLKVCSDGGCKTSGDIALAFGAGAHYVMLGGMLSGVHQDDTEKIEIDNKKYCRVYGMASKIAADLHSSHGNYKTYEGYEKLIDYRGDLSYVLQDILGGLRSTITYCNADSLYDLRTIRQERVV